MLRTIIGGMGPNNPGIGILDTETGQTYLELMNTIQGGHYELAEHLGISEEALESERYRGFTMCPSSNGIQIGGMSGLNPNVIIEEEYQMDLQNAFASLGQSENGNMGVGLAAASAAAGAAATDVAEGGLYLSRALGIGGKFLGWGYIIWTNIVDPGTAE